MPGSSALLLALVIVVLKGGGEAPAKSVRTDRRDLVLALEAGGERRIPLAEVAEIRFHRPREGAEAGTRKLLALLARIRRSPFAGEPLPPLPASPRQRDEQARRLADRIAKEPSPYRRIQQSFNLAALRYSLDDLEGCREALRRILPLCRGTDPRLYDATCARLAALQLGTDGKAPSEAWRDELLSDVLGPQDGERLKARLRALEELANRAR